MTTVRWVDEHESTNAEFRDGPFLHGDAVATLNQTHGRGRHDRTWVTVPGKGMAISVVFGLDPDDPIAYPTRIPLAAATAFIDAVETIAPPGEMWVKWPNDIYVGDRKVAGILTEMPSPDRVIVGLGVNLFHTSEELPVETATSLALEGLFVDEKVLAERWVTELRTAMIGIDTNDIIAWIADSFGMSGETVTVSFPDGTTATGSVRGLTGAGAMRLDTGNEIIEVVAGDVTRVRRSE